MDFPLPIRSITSTMDYTTPLFVDTNIVYQIDETKFMGLQKSSHASEPALVVDCKSTCNSKNIWYQTTTDEEEKQDLYNLIESLDVENTILFPDEILDLPEIRLDLPAVEVSVPKINPIVFTSVLEMPAENFNDSPVDRESSPCLTSNRDYSMDINESQLPSSEQYQRMPSCRYTIHRKSSKRNRHMSSSIQGDLVNAIETKEQMFAKRRKLDQNEFCLNFSTDLSSDSFKDDPFSQFCFYHETGYTNMFNFYDSSVMRFL